MAKVLLVEDDAVRSTLGVWLRSEGYEVSEVINAAAAMDQLASHDFDVAVIAMRLPGIDGLELCRDIRRRGETAVLAISAPTHSADVVEFLEAGADEYMTKPVSHEVFAARLRSLLRRADR